MKKTCFFLFLMFILGMSLCLCQIQTNDPKPFLMLDSIVKQGAEYTLIKPLVGKWEVKQIIYAMDGKKVLNEDTYSVEKKMIGNFLEETMQPSGKSKGKDFTRISYLSFNRTVKRWEYIVLDTRYPLMMFETSHNPEVIDGMLELGIESFVVPPFWGTAYAGMLAKQRRTITIGKDKIWNEQYWTLAGGEEFLAIKYIYKRIE